MGNKISITSENADLRFDDFGGLKVEGKELQKLIVKALKEGNSPQEAYRVKISINIEKIESDLIIQVDGDKPNG